ncbi:MAG: Coq4 family protein [Pseudomonadota bacterium]
MRRLIADKEDTEQVFHIIEALNGDAQRRNLMRFAATKRGQALLAEKPSLPDMLDDHDTLRRLPEGSVGRAYVDFMEREGLTAAGLVADSQKSYGDRPAYNDDLEYYGTRLRDTHDLFHVLTGYGRDALGEAALLGFSYSQNPGRGVIFIAYMGARQIAKVAPRGARIMDVLWEGKRHGRTTSKIVQEDIPALLAEPLDAARRRLGIEKPVLYRRALNIIAGVQGPQTVMQAA